MARLEETTTLNILCFTRAEAANIISLLVGQLAGTPVINNSSGACPDVWVMQDGVEKKRMAFVIETELSIFLNHVKDALIRHTSHFDFQISDEDMSKILNSAQGYWSDGWSVQNVIDLNKNLQECGCELPEDEALERIDMIQKKYRKVK